MAVRLSTVAPRPTRPGAARAAGRGRWSPPASRSVAGGDMHAADARTRIAVLGAAALVLALGPRFARADGAFPDSQIILTPADRPREIILVTNFGLIQSEDGGA